MDKIKLFFPRKSIKTAFTLYMISCVVSALLISLVLSTICQIGQSQIYKNYQAEYGLIGDDMVIEFEDDSYMITGPFRTTSIYSLFTPSERITYDTLGILSVALYPVCFIVCITVTSILFYKRQLQKPLEILDAAADNITDNNLDFEITYDKQDELGKLCLSFEKMRLALQENNIEMWRQIEERKRLNAAFSHDLRTPLTVLKGQSEMLIKYAPQLASEKVVSTAEMMQRHITRLESYVNTMNDLQRLEDIEIHKQPVTLSELSQQICLTGTSICKDKEFICADITDENHSLNLDYAVVIRVFENLLSNAFHFARKNISASIEVQEDYLYLTVSDDGKGFTEKDLSNATKPFYKSANETDNEHFGMGLYICKMLCEKHGGYLKLSNHSGAAVTAAFKQ